jgi:hypothetical protein
MAAAMADKAILLDRWLSVSWAAGNSLMEVVTALVLVLAGSSEALPVVCWVVGVSLMASPAAMEVPAGTALEDIALEEALEVFSEVS